MKPTIITSILLALLLLHTCQAKLKCKNGGRLILTRTKATPFQLDFKCLCPFNYFGPDCNEYRQVLCYFTKSHEAKYHPQFSETVRFVFQMDCYLKKLAFSSDSFMQISSTYQLPLNSTVIDNELWQNNYYIDPSLQIIWANQTSLFDADGNLIRSNTDDRRSDEEILDSYPKFNFEYQQNFFGMPYFDTVIAQNLTNVKYSNASKELGNVEVDFQRKSALPLEKTIVGSFNLNIDQSWFEYEVALLSLKINQYYGDGHKALTHTSMNSAHWRLFDSAHPRGNFISTTHSVSTWVWIMVATFLIAGLVMGGKYMARCRKYWRKRRQTSLVQERE